MEILLNPNCESLTGSLGKGFGYAIRRTKKRFFAKRNSKGSVPPDGHWRFILTCARQAKCRLYIADILVTADELCDALQEAHHFIAAQQVQSNAEKMLPSLKGGVAGRPIIYHATDIINLQKTFSL